jgi:hypothetical protein
MPATSIRVMIEASDVPLLIRMISLLWFGIA